MQQQWLSLLRKCFLDAQAIGEIDSGADVAQAVFETEAMLLAANFLFVMTNDPTPLAQAQGSGKCVSTSGCQSGVKEETINAWQAVIVTWSYEVVTCPAV